MIQSIPVTTLTRSTSKFCKATCFYFAIYKISCQWSTWWTLDMLFYVSSASFDSKYSLHIYSG